MSEVGSAPIRLPLQLRLLNGVGPAARALGFAEIRSDPDYYIARARRATGLHDFGAFEVRRPLQKMLTMLREEADLHLFGRIAAAQLASRNLENCLKLERAFQDDPSLADIDVERPIIIICTPRTGSTLLHNLLAQHPNVRAPRMWELHRPCPPPRPNTEHSDPRIEKSEGEFGLYYRLIPEMRAIHYFAPTAIEECTHLFLNVFTCRLSFATMANRTSYQDWVLNADMVPAYRAYKRQLQVLMRHYPGKTLVMKSPAHILCMEALHEVFPHARIVHIHRDPATAAGSFGSLTEGVQISMRQSVNLPAIGDMWNQMWTPALLNSIRWRQEGKLDVLDLNFRDVVADPIGAAETVFRRFGLDTADALGANIANYLGENPKNRYGTHTYHLGRYGLDRATLHREYAEYIDHFGVQLEAER